MTSQAEILPSPTRVEGKTKTSNKGEKGKGFTLAEVLVTLGIIGVVSAMTIPTLINNYQRQTYVAQLHKFYNEFSQALMQYQTDRNAVNLKEAGFATLPAIDNWVKNYMKIVQDCGNSGADCFPSTNYKRINGNSMGESMFRSTAFNYYVLASGTAFAIAPHEASRMSSLYVDINGDKGPNVVGRDTFALYIYSDNTMIDDASEENFAPPLTREQREDAYQKYCVNGENGFWYGCFGKILNDGWQMTY